MKYCTSCGNELEETAVFCPKCGQKQNTSEKEISKETRSVSGAEVKEKLTTSYSHAKASIQKNEYVHYFMRSLKKPTRSIAGEKSSYGWIQMLLFALTTTLAIYSIMSGLIKISMTNSFGSFLGADSGMISLLRNQLLPRIFVISIVTILAFAGVSFLILKLVKKSQQKFGQYLAEFGALFSLNIFVLAIVSVLTLLFATEITILLATLVLSLSFIITFAAYNFHLYYQLESRKLDKMYVLLLSNLLLIFTLMMLITIQLAPIFRFIQELEYQIGGLW